ncbi:MAG: hypothetical protein C3F18_05515 [Nitrosomonadales bacterium]|nr:MAG: hypothetical protein C3F18_05515 [Nitrosomonadales bacterium]
MADVHCMAIRKPAAAGSAPIGFGQRPRVRGALRGVQAKLKVSQPRDPLEREAGHVADRIMRMADPAASAAPLQPPPIQRRCARCKDELQLMGDAAAPGEAPAVADNFASLGDGGVPLTAQARSFYEPRFGADFSAVRIHHDQRAAYLARSIGARAFTYRNSIYFNEGEYQPHSAPGRHLLAHELAHVRQQASGDGASTLQREAQPAQQDERVTACLNQSDDILPGRVGLLVHIDRTLQLEEILGPEYLPLQQQIRQSPEARRFVCEAGVPAIVALWDTRTSQGVLDVAAACQALSTRPARYAREVMPRRRQERRLAGAEQGARAVGGWALTETRSRSLASSMLLPTLPAPQLSNLQQSITRLQEALPVMEAAATRISGLSGNLNTLIEELTNARQVFYREYGVTQARVALGRADATMGTVMDGLHAVQAQANIDALAGEANQVQRALTALINQGESITQEDIDALRERARTLRTHLRESITGLNQWPGSARKVMFLLRYLIALSSPGYANAPSAAEVEQYRPQLDMVSEDLERLFGGGMMDTGLDFIADAARRIKAQLDVRAGMEQALGRATALVPAQADVQDYFTSLADQPNNIARRAYEEYASAFFEHSVVARMEDLAVANIDDIFARPPGAVGVRGLVCSGYAVLGARLFELAGGRVERFIIGVRASDQQLQAGNTLDDAHALAQISRNGRRFFVSNDSVVDSEQEGIGPNAVAWTRPDNPIYIGRGNSVAAALRSVQQRMSQRIRQLGP